MGTTLRLRGVLLTSTACLRHLMPRTHHGGAGASARDAHAIEKKISPAFDGARFGDAGLYESWPERPMASSIPATPHNAVIQDIQLPPRNGRGVVEYTATFQIVKPIDMAKASRLMWHDVPNRGGRITIAPVERTLGDVGLSSAGRVTVQARRRPDRTTITSSCRWRKISTARRSPAASCAIRSHPFMITTDSDTP